MNKKQFEDIAVIVWQSGPRHASSFFGGMATVLVYGDLEVYEEASFLADLAHVRVLLEIKRRAA